MKTSLILTVALALTSMNTSFAQNDGERIPAKGFAVHEAHGHFKPYEFTRHAVGDNDIRIEILYAGICHSDLHHVFADWGAEEYPMVPGHEIAGRVVAVGKNVTKFKVGDYAGIGCMIGSCRHCDACEHDLE
ncbi:MAG: alcohol dehydrogenase catalytic domain-containing protein [Bacteroides sp.]|nr:alcohol dehydrogenase catalytic domain-containing protein [Bacteroides sp.]MCM1388801.1 alcohol dehydrogenase catalytic domain-containing protein [Bacteroides sp.]